MGTKRSTPWGTAVALGALDGVLATSDGGLKLIQQYQQYPAVDQIMPMDGDLGPVGPVDFGPEFALQYELGAIGRWVAAIFGTAGAPVMQGAGPAYLHMFQYADAVTHFFTVGVERPGAIWEVASAMPFKLNLKLADARIGGAITLRGNTLINDSAVNTATQMDALTYAERGKRIHFSHGKFLMNVQVDGALADPADKLEISDFELNLERSIDSLHVAGGANLALPVEGDFPKNTLKIVLPRASAANLAYLSTFQALTAQKASLVFTGPLIADTYYYQVALYFPRLRFAGPPDVPLEPVLKNTLTFEIEAAAAAPTGMDYARPYGKVINLQTTDYLA
jgi:hypothetical protein